MADLDPAEIRWRQEVSLRLKSARWLNGRLDDKGKLIALPPEELAQHPRLLANAITANAIAEIERMVKKARPMELRELAYALSVGLDWFGEEKKPASRGTAAFDELQQALRDLGLTPDPSQAEEPSVEGEEDRPGGATGGGGA